MSNTIAVRGGAGRGRVERVRNLGTGRVLPCCWSDCERDGDDRYRFEVSHPQARWEGERLVYIFCGEAHRAFYMSASRLSGVG